MARMRFGVHKALEEEANAIIADSLKGVTSHAAKSDILTPWKEQERRRREVYVKGGSPDPAIRKGMFKKAANRTHPQLNSREGIAPPLQGAPSSLSAWVSENGWSGSDAPPGEDLGD